MKEKGWAEVAERITEQDAQHSLQDHLCLTSCRRCGCSRRSAPRQELPALNDIRQVYSCKDKKRTGISGVREQIAQKHIESNLKAVLYWRCSKKTCPVPPF